MSSRSQKLWSKVAELAGSARVLAPTDGGIQLDHLPARIATLGRASSENAVAVQLAAAALLELDARLREFEATARATEEGTATVEENGEVRRDDE